MFASDRQGLPGDALRPWDNGESSRPENPREADGLDVGALLEDLWNDWVSWPDEDDPDYTERRAPFTLKWPGLAAPEHTPLAPAERQHCPGGRVATDQEEAQGDTDRLYRPNRRRPACRRAAGDRLGRLGEQGESVLPLTAALRSWENRFARGGMRVSGSCDAVRRRRRDRNDDPCDTRC